MFMKGLDLNFELFDTIRLAYHLHFEESITRRLTRVLNSYLQFIYWLNSTYYLGNGDQNFTQSE